MTALATVIGGNIALKTHDCVPHFALKNPMRGERKLLNSEDVALLPVRGSAYFETCRSVGAGDRC